MTAKSQSLLNLAASAVVLLLAGTLLFARLGHYALWDDEAVTALGGLGVLRTGDTSVMLDHNLVAWGGGLVVSDLHDRLHPPLPSYVAAASLWLFGQSAFAARLPFALFGLATIAMILWWASRDRASLITQLLLGIGLLGNVSLFLFSRQCRYYQPTILLTVAIAYVYLHWDGRKRGLCTLALLSVLLFATNYLNYFALYGCLAADYLFWRRRECPLQPSDWLVLTGPQFVLCGALGYVWNPFRTSGLDPYVAVNSFSDICRLFWWTWRDMNRCEFFSAPLVLAAPILGFATKRPWLLRGSLALLLYVTLISVVSPQPVKDSSFADVRYLPALIPLCIATEVMVIRVLLPKHQSLALLVALVAFGSNLFHGEPLLHGGLRSTFASYLGELRHPLRDPYSVAAQWLKRNVKSKESVWVVPDYATYPLMFHYPEPVYAWQLDCPPLTQFKDLPAIHFKKVLPPDYVVTFGPYRALAVAIFRDWTNAPFYRHVATLDCFWFYMHRPELFWHSFVPVTELNPENRAICIFRRLPSQHTAEPCR